MRYKKKSAIKRHSSLRCGGEWSIKNKIQNELNSGRLWLRTRANRLEQLLWSFPALDISSVKSDLLQQSIEINRRINRREGTLTNEEDGGTCWLT